MIDGCGVGKRDDVMRKAAVVVHLPVGSIDVGEGRTRAIADEQQLIANSRTVAIEIRNGITIGFAGTERESIVASPARQKVLTAATIDDVITRIADDGIVGVAAGAL